MTRLHWILAALVLLTWVPSFAWFFYRDILGSLHARRQRRAQARERHLTEAAARARLLDELAQKYMPPAAAADQRTHDGSVKPPPSAVAGPQPHPTSAGVAS
jgi:hypothetical protein